MKRFLFLPLLLALAAPCYAQDCPTIQSTTAQVDFETANHFAQLTKLTGTTCLAYYGEFPPKTKRMDFVAPGDNYQKWGRMLTVTLIDTGSADAADGLKPLTDELTNRLKAIGGTFDIIAQIDTRNASPSQRGIWYGLRYALGAGDTFENSMAVIRTVGPHLVAMLQLQKRGGAPLEPETISSFLGANGFYPSEGNASQQPENQRP